ncbi:hypothetical protein HK105_203578 [Polyrhizophydium stewartii]|uniref:VASP tetramerisation domain-containing protein n=1 Tax=Polyrhizophydium stewartii TaxID=2732419 RepID=A0ABR4NBE5_9FUNG
MYKYAFTKKLRLDMIVENFMPACSQSDAADESAAADATETSGGAESAAVLADKDLAGDAAGGMATAVGGLARTSSLQADQLNQTMAGVGLSGGSAAAPGPSAASLVAGVDASTAVDPAGAADGSASSDGAVTTSGTTGISGAQGQVQADDMAQAERSLDGAISGVPAARRRLSRSAPIADRNNAGEPGKGPSSKQDTALAELKGFISTILSSKLEEIKSTLQNKLAAQEEAINSKLRKIEGGAEDDKKKDGKAKPKK